MPAASWPTTATLDTDTAFTALLGHARRHHLRLTDLAHALVDRRCPGG
jgi:hypothetical protein